MESDLIAISVCSASGGIKLSAILFCALGDVDLSSFSVSDKVRLLLYAQLYDGDRLRYFSAVLV